MRDSFCGWYFKCQSDTQTMAVIPALHGSKSSIQFITDEGSFNIDFPYEQFKKPKGNFNITVGENYFGKDGIRLNLNTAVGSLRFDELSPLRYDIMGPFCLVPFMECRHSVVSMRHKVNGELCINGVNYRFSDALGYIEGDRGHSFPKQYTWTQSFFDGGSLMLSVADIPLGKFRFTGVIGVILWQGKEYRLATYLGAKAVKIEKGEIVIRQGKRTLSVRLIERNAHPLRAPVSGNMNRTIRESAVCRAAYHFEQDGHTLFSFETKKASFEYEYPF